MDGFNRIIEAQNATLLGIHYLSDNHRYQSIPKFSNPNSYYELLLIRLLFLRIMLSMSSPSV